MQISKLERHRVVKITSPSDKSSYILITTNKGVFKLNGLVNGNVDVPSLSLQSKIKSTTIESQKVTLTMQNDNQIVITSDENINDDITLHDYV